MNPCPPTSGTWQHLTPAALAHLFAGAPARWWLSGGRALDHWLGAPIRARANTDVSVIAGDLAPLLTALPDRFSAWALAGDRLLAWDEAPDDLESAAVYVHDDRTGGWVLKVNIEDGTEDAWVYRRDARLQLPWRLAVPDIGGIPTGAPEVQLVWKALRPRPEDDVDKDAVLPALSTESRAWWESAVLSIHPHSSWAIHVRSPFAPAKASWNRGRR